MPLTLRSHPGQWVDGGWPTAVAETVQRLGDYVISVWEMGVSVVTDIERVINKFWSWPGLVPSVSTTMSRSGSDGGSHSAEG